VGVYVLGMHRSGTSAVTRVVNLLGVPIGREQRLMPIQPDNPAGFWEHLALMQVNDAVLERLGGAWDAPAVPPDGFATSDGFADLREWARREWDATYDGDRWVFKDPRASVMLPFWKAVLGPGGDVGHVAIVVLRDPLDVAASLRRRNELPSIYCFALWERYTRLVLRDVAGLPVLVLDYDALVDDPSRAHGLREFLAAHGQISGDVRFDEIKASLAVSLRHSRHDPDAFGQDARVTAGQRALHETCARLTGAHGTFTTPALPPESATTAALIDARRGAGGEDPRSGALDTVTRALGTTEAALDRCEHAVAEHQETYDAVGAALGYTAIGRLERTALTTAGRLRRVQQRITRR
jgi:hypothetical protein